jgi:hypothetical protein
LLAPDHFPFRLRRSIRRLLSAAALVSCLMAVTGCMSTGSFVPRSHDNPAVTDLGPLLTHDESVRQSDRVRVAGPFYETTVATNGATFMAVRPFYSKTVYPDKGIVVRDVLWPLGTLRTRNGDTSWRVFPAFGRDYNDSQHQEREKWSVFPFLYGGRTAEGERNFAFFPFGGKLYDVLGRDYVWFVMFPMYGRSEINDVVSHSVLWPFGSWSRGEGVRRHRIFPFYGYSWREDQWEKRFILWPFFTSTRSLKPDHDRSAYILFPLYGRGAAETGASMTMVAPPFIKFSQAEGIREINCPWPIIQYRRGDLDKFYLWPLCGWKQSANVYREFAFWPFLWHERHVTEKRRTYRYRVFPFLITEKSFPADPASTAVIGRHLKLWPLLRYSRGNDSMNLRVLDLWPNRRSSGADRNWAPLWTLYSRVREADRAESELLWGLYRRRTAPEGNSLSLFPFVQTSSRQSSDGTLHRRWRFLYGLVGRERDGTSRRWQFLYGFHLGRSPRKLASPEAAQSDNADSMTE